jgi:hypothetical protein
VRSLTRAAKPPAGPGWVHEIKHDGYRLQVRREGDVVRLFREGDVVRLFYGAPVEGSPATAPVSTGSPIWVMETWAIS